MSKDYFEQLKADFLATYAEYLCEESLTDINKSQTVAQFIAILHKYLHFLNFKPVPTIEWARRWFWGQYQQEANENGVYFDQILVLDNPPQESIVLLGKCRVNAFIAKPTTTYFMLQDESSLSLVTYGTANINVRLKSDLCKCKVLQKSIHSRIKIRRV